ncbi:hypothetical protein SOVF_089880, partial [Spinacia oleracea]
KRLFAESGSSSSSFLDPDIIEIPRPSTWKKPSKQKSVVGREIIVVDDEDPDDAVIVCEKVAYNSKGKKPMVNYPAGHEVITIDGAPSPLANGFVKGKCSPHLPSIDDGFDGCDIVVYDDGQYDMLQSHFNSVKIPSGVEAMMPTSVASEKHAGPASSSFLHGTQKYSNVSSSKVDPFKSASSVEPYQIKTSVSKYARNKSKRSSFSLPTSQIHGQTSGVIQPIPQWPIQHPHTHIKPSPMSLLYMPYSGGSTYSQGTQYSFHGSQNLFGTSSNLPSGIVRSKANNLRLEDGICADILPPSTDGQGNSSEASILKKLELFKKFDTLEDHLGQLYGMTKESSRPSKGWVNKIADEWRILEKDLPDTIFVRVYEARMDLLKAVMVAADGTPYHDGLFFFDVQFPASYPTKPPSVKYHAHGLRINPNLYNCGKVCLSLLGTWSGAGDENWRPLKSTMLQVLVSIQGLILNADPYYNEPGFARSRNTPQGAKKSRDYSENVFLLSLKTMLYTMRNPPKHFEDLVYGHFHKRGHDILAACRAYLDDGVEVGRFVKGKPLPAAAAAAAVQGKRKTCSPLLKVNLPSYIKSLVEAFTKIGVKDCNKFLITNSR